MRHGWWAVGLALCAAVPSSADLYPPLERVWSVPVEGGCYMTPTVARDWVYVGGLDRNVYALDRLTGTIRWQTPVGGMVYGGIAVAGDVVLAAADNQVIYCLDATRGELKWEKALDGVLYASPVVDGKTVYIGSGSTGTLYALEVDDGAEVWTYTMGDRMGSGLALDDGVLYVPSYDGKLHAVDAATGQAKWTWDAGGPVDSIPLVADGRVYVKTPGDTVVALNPDGGTVVWTARPPQALTLGEGPTNWSALTRWRDLLIFGSLDGRLHALNCETGAPVWVSAPGEPRPCPPAPAGELGWCGGKDGVLAAYELATGDQVERLLPAGALDASQLLSGMMWPPAIVDEWLYISIIGQGVMAFRGEPDGTVWRTIRERTRDLNRVLAPAYQDGPTPTPAELAALADLSAKAKGFCVWESRRSGGWELYRINLDGSGFTQLTHLTKPNDPLAFRAYLRPLVSPDGTQVAFSWGRRGGPNECWVVPAEGGDAHKLAEGALLRWDSPTALVLARERRIWRIDLASGSEEPLSDVEIPGFDSGMVGDLTPQVDALVLRTPRANEFFSFAEKRTVRQLGGCEPQFTRDGKYVYWVQGPKDFRVWRIGSDEEFQMLGQPPTVPFNYTYFPTISNDGKWLAYGASPGEHSHETGDYEIYVVPLENLRAAGTPVRLTWNTATDRWPYVWIAPQ